MIHAYATVHTCATNVMGYSTINQTSIDTISRCTFSCDLCASSQRIVYRQRGLPALTRLTLPTLLCTNNCENTYVRFTCQFEHSSAQLVGRLSNGKRILQSTGKSFICNAILTTIAIIESSLARSKFPGLQTSEAIKRCTNDRFLGPILCLALRILPCARSLTANI